MLNPATFWLRKVARTAARNHNWPAAATAYRAYLDRRPGDARTWVQYGHASKEGENFRVAADAYGQALAIDPGMAETWWHLAYVRKRLGDRAGAVDCCVRVLMVDPTFVAAVDELVALGAHRQIPAQARVAGMAVPFDDNAPSGSAICPLSRYAAFRQALAIARAPSGPTTPCPVTVVIDARAALPADARATLSALLDQTDEHWQALVLAPPRIQEHPVASLATLDHRVRFVGTALVEDDLADARHTLLIAAGTLLDRQAIAWFAFVSARTDCVAAYCDHDRSIDHWKTGRRFMQPVFHPMFDPDWFAHPSHAPLAVLIDHARMPVQDWHTDDKARAICAAAAIGPVAHLPLLLASERMLTPQAEQAPPDAWARDDAAPPSAPVPAEPARPNTRAKDRIQVVIQTRDEAEMLRSAIDSLRAMALQPNLLDIVVVDNRSREAATARLLAELRQQETASVLTHDAPFNWSHANNIAVETGTAPLLLFLNNDTQMLTNGWDDLVRAALSVQDVGALGATLFYPDRTIQHAGIVMGMGTGGPVHEGVGKDDASGPNERWQLRRTASAVTGAFLAMPRDLFDAIGGFDAVRFAIAFNDIDLCLRIRAAGRRIVMMSDIHVIHHESKTRGTNVTRSQVAWDLDELGRMHDRWGTALFDDPAYNPHWADIGPPFDGCRVPSRREIMRHIDRSARPNPWVPVEARDEPVWW